MELLGWFGGVSMLLCNCYGGGGGTMLLWCCCGGFGELVFCYAVAKVVLGV